jgi:hypothetical protein
MKVIASVFGVLCIVAISVIAQQPEIVGFARDGNLTFNSASEGKDYRLEFAPSASGPWQASLIDAPITGAVMTATTPQFFRVVEAEPRQLNPCIEQHLIAQGYDWDGNYAIEGKEAAAISQLPFQDNHNDSGASLTINCDSLGDLRALTNLVSLIVRSAFPHISRDVLNDDLLPQSLTSLAWMSERDNYGDETLGVVSLTNLHNLETIDLVLGAGSTVDLTGLTQPIGGSIHVAYGAAFVYVSSTTNFTDLYLSGGASFVIQ